MSTIPPSFSIVVASSGQRRRLIADLAAAAPQCTREDVELIVARADTSDGLTELTQAFPNARFIGAPPTTDVQELRSLGLTAAKGDVVTLLDHTDGQGPFHKRWLHELRRRCSLHRSRRTSPEAGAQGGLLPHPYLSVVVPVHQGGRVITDCLAALARSELPRALWELIVVDDASTDETAVLAARFADVVVRLPGRAHGTAYARNRGFEFARGECVAFVNADVCVHPDTLTQFTLVLAREPEVTAVFGSFDVPAASGRLMSRYRNLRLKYHRQENCASAETFCASCGAVRSDAFAAVDMFDEWHFPRHQIEDFELGHRLRQHGYRVVMRPEIRATHMKRWTLREMIVADLHDRMVTWMHLFDRRAVRWERARDPVNPALTWLALLLTVFAIRADWPLLLAGAVVCLGAVLRSYLPQHRFFVREHGLPFALAVIPLELLSYLVSGVAVVVGWLLREVVGEPKPHPRVEAFAEIGVRTWPPVPRRSGAQAVVPEPQGEARVAGSG